MEIVAAALVLGAFGAALAGVSAARRRPLVLVAPLALAVLVCFEALLLDVLSLFHALAAPALLAAHSAVIAAALAIAWRRAAPGAGLPALARRARAALRALGWPLLLAVPAAILCAISALRYLPNNWDSMTYRLARVAHWLQHHSVEPYRTHVERQVLLQPGAEYVLAALQGMAGSDRLASLLQLGSWLLVILAVPALARLAGAPRRVAPWAAVVVAALPMGVLQASSTQNDLVASALTLAVVAATLPFLHRAPRWRLADAVLLGLAVAAAALVKATAAVAVAPFLLLALARVVLAVPRRPQAIATAVGVALAVAIVPVGPEIVRRARPDLSASLDEIAKGYTYRGLSELPDRLENLGRGIVRHVPSPRGLVAAVGVEGWCAPGQDLCEGMIFRPHEDNAGNPLHVALVLLAAGVAAARFRRLPARTAAFLGAVVAAWVLFHFAFRDNTWISRLETPTYVLAALGVAAWGSRPEARSSGPSAPRRRKGVAPEVRASRPRVPVIATAVAATLALVAGTNVAYRNEIRPPLPGDARVEQLGYYANLPNIGRAHDAVLRAAAQLRCDRIGLYIGADSFDYPLTWRAMQQGREVRHVFGADPWPCMVFSDQRLSGQPETFGWTRTSLPFVFLNGGATGAAQASPAPAAHGG
jgi:hypothetical protein